MILPCFLILCSSLIAFTTIHASEETTSRISLPQEKTQTENSTKIPIEIKSEIPGIQSITMKLLERKTKQQIDVKMGEKIALNPGRYQILKGELSFQKDDQLIKLPIIGGTLRIKKTDSIITLGPSTQLDVNAGLLEEHRIQIGAVSLPGFAGEKYLINPPYKVFLRHNNQEHLVSTISPT